jgi:hypothetical protein
MYKLNVFLFLFRVKSGMKLKCGTDKLKHGICFASKMAVPEVADKFVPCGQKYKTKISHSEPSNEYSHEKCVGISCHHLNRAAYEAHHYYFFNFTLLIIGSDFC